MDARLFELINGAAGHSHAADLFFADVARFGLYLLVALYVALWFWPGARLLRQRRQKAAMLAAGSGLIALGVNLVIGWLWARPRPFVFHPAILLLPGSRDPSFPSDHAALAFAFALILLVLLNRRLGLFALLFAALLAFSRVFVGEHYPTDVLAGAAVGVAAALTLALLRQRFDPLFNPTLRVARKIRLA